MSSKRGPKSTKVDVSMINSVTVHNTQQTFSADVDGQYVFEGYKTVGGCSNSAVYIELKYRVGLLSMGMHLVGHLTIVVVGGQVPLLVIYTVTTVIKMISFQKVDQPIHGDIHSFNHTVEYMHVIIIVIISTTVDFIWVTLKFL